MLDISHCNYRRHILQNRKHKRYQMNLNSHYKKSLFVLWVSVSAMLVYIHQKNIAQVFILERYFFVSICLAAIPGICLSVFLAAVLLLC